MAKNRDPERKALVTQKKLELAAFHFAHIDKDFETVAASVDIGLSKLLAWVDTPEWEAEVLFWFPNMSIESIRIPTEPRPAKPDAPAKPAQSVTGKVRHMRDLKITTAVYHYVHHTTDPSALSDIVNVSSDTVLTWQRSRQWSQEVSFWQSEHTETCQLMGLDEIAGVDREDVNGSLLTFGWVWANILQDNNDFCDTDVVKSLSKLKKKRDWQVGIETPLQRAKTLARNAYLNMRSLLKKMNKRVSRAPKFYRVLVPALLTHLFSQEAETRIKTRLHKIKRVSGMAYVKVCNVLWVFFS